jgi:protein PhnA
LVSLFLINNASFGLNLSKMEVKDSNGNILNDGDTVTLIKDLKVKGSSLNLKRGTVVKRIRLTDNEDEVDCRVNGQSIVLRTEFLKKA